MALDDIISHIAATEAALNLLMAVDGPHFKWIFLSSGFEDISSVISDLNKLRNCVSKSAAKIKKSGKMSARSNLPSLMMT